MSPSGTNSAAPDKTPRGCCWRKIRRLPRFCPFGRQALPAMNIPARTPAAILATIRGARFRLDDFCAWFEGFFAESLAHGAPRLTSPPGNWPHPWMLRGRMQSMCAMITSFGSYQLSSFPGLDHPERTEPATRDTMRLLQTLRATAPAARFGFGRPRGCIFLSETITKNSS